MTLRCHLKMTRQHVSSHPLSPCSLSFSAHPKLSGYSSRTGLPRTALHVRCRFSRYFPRTGQFGSPSRHPVPDLTEKERNTLFSKEKNGKSPYRTIRQEHEIQKKREDSRLESLPVKKRIDLISQSELFNAYSMPIFQKIDRDQKKTMFFYRQQLSWHKKCRTVSRSLLFAKSGTVRHAISMANRMTCLQKSISFLEKSDLGE